MNPAGTRAFIACTKENYVLVLDLKTLQVTGKFDAGPQPNGIAWASNKR